MIRGLANDGSGSAYSWSGVMWLGLMTAVVLLIAAWANTVRAADENQQGPFEALQVVDTEQLESFRGREGNAVGDTNITVATLQELEAAVSDTSFDAAGSIVSGAVSISDHALDNFNGVGVLLLNTGNGNAVNIGVGVNFYLQ